jgi:hypothetical protein
MGHRGPRPVRLALLKKYAVGWAALLCLLRDGQAGQLLRLKPGKEAPIVVASVIPADRAPTQTALLKLGKLRGKDGILWLVSPIYPESKIWENLKRARSTKEIRAVLADVGKYLRKEWSGASSSEKGELLMLAEIKEHTRKEWRDLPSHLTDENETLIVRQPRWADTQWSKLVRAATNNAQDILNAKDLPHYPRAERPTSDNKRIEFFAKVFSGLALGIAPLTATKRLSGWSPLRPESPQPPRQALGPTCPHCGIEEVKGFPPRAIVRCPSCDQRYYVADN